MRFCRRTRTLLKVCACCGLVVYPGWRSLDSLNRTAVIASGVTPIGEGLGSIPGVGGESARAAWLDDTLSQDDVQLESSLPTFEIGTKVCGA